MEGDIIKCLGQIKEKELVELCQNLIRIPSHKDTLSREKEIALFLKDFIEGEGIEVVLQEVAEGRSNVIARLRGTGKGPNLLFNGHMDTVPPLGMKDPYSAKVKEEDLGKRSSRYEIRTGGDDLCSNSYKADRNKT